MDKLATMDTIGSSFRPWLSCQGICLLNRQQTGDTDSVQPVILLPVQRDSQETFILCEARMLWYSADRTSSQQLRDTTKRCEIGENLLSVSDPRSESQERLIDVNALIPSPALQYRPVSSLHPYAAVERSVAPVSPVPE